MQNIKNDLKNAFYNDEMNQFFNLLEEYLSQGYGVDYDMIHYIVLSLINVKKYNQAYSILKGIEKSIYPENAQDLCFLYCYCFKPVDAEKIYFSYNINNIPILIKIYLQQGRVEEAYQLINDNINKNLSNDDQRKLQKYKKIIENHQKYGSYIETEYTSFIKNGNILQRGHIIFLKTNPSSREHIYKDNREANRPYMIWKIEGNDLYIFPVKIKENKKAYILYCQKYQNFNQDRIISDHLYHTTLDNILSVKDKVIKEDYECVLKNLFNTIYFGQTEQEINNNRKFLQDYIGEVKPYDIVEYVDKITRGESYYLVLDKNDKKYQVIKIDLTNRKILDNDVILIDNKKIVYRKIKPSLNIIKELLLQLQDMEHKNLKIKKLNK